MTVSSAALKAAQAANGLSIWSILVFPSLFTAGMALVDTIDSILMTGAYGWAFAHPIRKLWYNLTITVASVAVAVFIGGVEVVDALVDKLGLKGGVWTFIAALNDSLSNFGLIVIGVFVSCWLLSVAIYRWRGYDNLVTEQGQCE
jgi:high-affinity nickel-transport protein